MRNKVEIRAFAVEQVVKMRCMSECTIEDVVEQAKLVEDYVVGDAHLSEFANEESDLLSFLKERIADKLDNSEESPTMGWSLG